MSVIFYLWIRVQYLRILSGSPTVVPWFGYSIIREGGGILWSRLLRNLSSCLLKVKGHVNNCSKSLYLISVSYRAGSRRAKIIQKNRKKFKKFHAWKCCWGLKASSVAWTSRRPRDRYLNCSFWSKQFSPVVNFFHFLISPPQIRIGIQPKMLNPDKYQRIRYGPEILYLISLIFLCSWREDILLPWRPEPGPSEHGADQADHEAHRCSRHR
jgi:hypothetical protein